MKKISLLLAVLLVTVGLVLPVGAMEKGYPPDTSREISAEAIYLVNLDTDTVIYEKNGEEPRAPASLTKILTAILALENTTNIDTEMVTYPLYVQDYLYEYGLNHGAVSTGDMRAGDTFTMREFLLALMLPSANEAALTIADHIGGSQEGFVSMLNQRAKELGATDTNFVNPNGLPEDGHVSSAKDMAILAQHAMTLPHFMDIVTQSRYEAIPPNRDITLTWDSTIWMQNPDSPYYYPGLEGIKTGTLESAGRCFVSTATRDGFQYLLVLLGSTYEPGGQQDAFLDAQAIYDWVFTSFGYKTLVNEGTPEGELPVRLSSESDHVTLLATEHFSVLMPNHVETSSVERIVETTTDSLDAPVKKGEMVGELILRFDGKELGRVPLETSESIEASSWLVFWEKFKAMTKTFWFKFAVVFVVLLVISYSILMVVRNRNRRRRRPYQQGWDNRPRR